MRTLGRVLALLLIASALGAVATASATPRLQLYFDPDATVTAHIGSAGDGVVQTFTLYVLSSGVEDVGGIRFRVTATVCLPLSPLVADLSPGSVDGTPDEGVSAIFDPPLSAGPPGHILLGTLEVVYFYMCFHGPGFELEISPHPDETEVLILDAGTGTWRAAAGGTVYFGHGLPEESATMGGIKRMYR